MKKIVHILFTATVFFMMSATVHADSTIAQKCNYEPVEGVNPDYQTMNCLLTETALEYNVPPEIVKAIAEGESGGWDQFDENGDPIVSDDGGIGIMQITNQSDYDIERLKSDVVYNIEAGVEILNDMYNRTDLPTINDDYREIIEHWYFAVMAYNGTKPVNSPIVQETGERNPNAYQEEIFEIIEDYSLIDLHDLSFSKEDFEYDSNSDENIEFLTMSYEFDHPLTWTKHQFEEGNPVTTTSDYLNIRKNPTTTDSPIVGKLYKGDVATITGDFTYDADPNKKNHFVWYPVKLSDGTTGYAASYSLKFKFNDLPDGHYAEEAIYYLQQRDILAGVGYGDFGYTQELTRWQAAILLNRANDISLTNRPNPGFTDISTDYQYYEHIAAAVDEGYFSGYEDDSFKPNRTLTRAEMASILQRTYNFSPDTSGNPFTDVSDQWFAGAVDHLFNAGITVGTTETTYGPQAAITREQFAVFLARSINENFRLK